MKSIILFALFTLLAVATQEEFYHSDDTLDIDAVVSETERMKRFVGCYLDKAPCTDRAAGYKALIPDALATKCNKCSDKLKHLAHGFFKGLKAALPEEYINMRLKYDPENKYFDDFEKAVEPY